jgi:hypothetical protein
MDVASQLRKVNVYALVGHHTRISFFLLTPDWFHTSARPSLGNQRAAAPFSTLPFCFFLYQISKELRGET